MGSVPVIIIDGADHHGLIDGWIAWGGLVALWTLMGISVQAAPGVVISHISDWWFRYFLWNCGPINVTLHYWWLVNTDSGNGLVLSEQYW